MPQGKRRGDRDTRLLVLLVAAGAALRFATLDLQSFWYDEAVTVTIVRLDFAGMLERIPESESTPPLYYVLAWLWSKPFGTWEVGLRSLSALLGTLAIPVFYAVARELASRRAALVVAALAAFNPLLVWYSQEARAYALLMLLAGLSMLFFARLLRRPERRSYVLWAVTSALALATHYFAAFLVIPEAVWLLASGRARRAALVAVACVGAAGLALLPLALEQRGLDLASFIRTASLPYRLARTPKQFLLGFEAPLEVPLAVVAGVIALAAFVAALRRPDGRGPWTAAGLGLLVVALPLLLAVVGVDYFDTRNLTPAWLPLAIVIAAGLSRGRIGLAGAGALCAAGLAGTIGVALTPLWQRDNWRGAAAALGPAAVTRALVLTPAQSGRVPLRLYRPRTRPMAAAVARVREVVLVSNAGRTHEEIRPERPPRPTHPSVPGFSEARRRYAENFTVVVLRSPWPVGVTPALLAPYRLLEREKPAILIEPPASVRSAGRGGRARHPGGE